MLAASASATRPLVRPLLVLAAVAVLALAPPAGAQDGDLEAGPIAWVDGPTTVQLGRQAEIEIPAGYRFADAEGTRTFMEMLENPPSGREVGLVIPPESEDLGFWFVVFEFDDVGYVKDDEKDDLDAGGILDSIRRGTEEANEVRERQGWAPVEVVGWERQPFYNEATHNLEWAILGRSDGGDSVNYSTRLLGRRGVMSADLVLGPEQLAAVAPAYQALLGGFRFRPGDSYAEFSAGDKIAKYGLTALVAGGAGVVAAKTGLLARFWKLIVAGMLAVGAFFKKVLGRSRTATAEAAPPSATRPG